MTRSKWLIAALALALVAGSANAAILTVTTDIAYAFDPVTKDYLPTIPDKNVVQGTPVGYWIDVYFTISGMATGEQGFGNMSYGMSGNPGVVTDSAQGYYADATTFTYHNTKGALVTAAVWSDNKDAGTAGDFQGILVGINGFGLGWVGEDPRGTLGQSGEVYVGSVPVIWNGVTYTQLDLDIGVTGSTTPFSVILTTKQLLGKTQTMTFTGDPGEQFISFGEIPEPATIALLSIGGLLALRRRRS